MKTSPIIVTIDGPAASGKTSVSRRIAEIHGWQWVSTGAFYRGLAYVANREGISLDDDTALAKLCLEKFWGVEMRPDRTRVLLRGQDVTDNIYKEEIGTWASMVSRFPQVRANLLEAQRNCAKGGPGLVAEGRDCGTVIFPKADLKVFITAGTDDRAERRAKEQGRNIEEMKLAQVLRDLQDSSRKAAPMQIPTDAHVIDTSGHNLEEVVQILDGILRKELELST
jgi:cytidylate kinase